MLTKLRRAVCAVCAVAVMAAASATAAADYVYNIDDSKLCDEINADTKNISGSEGSFVTKFSDSSGEDFLSLRFRLFNEFADLDFWNDDNVSVSVDVRLDTKGKDVIGCMPAFTTNWSWVDPSDYTELKYGEWITVTESGKHFYEGFGKKKPAYILFQVRTNWTAPAQGDVEISVKNFRIVTGDSTTVVESEQTTATSATTADTTTTASSAAEPTDEPVIATVEAKATVDASTAETTGTSDVSAAESETKEAAVTTGGDDSSSAPEQTTSVKPDDTSINIPEMEGEQPTNYADFYKQESPVMMIVIIVGVAAVVGVGAIVGYIIYKKKKYY